MLRLIRYRRLAVLTACVILAYVGLLGWLFHRQVEQHARFEQEARKNVTFKRVLPARRGGIADARGVLLATSVPVKTVCADPALVAPQRQLLARELAPLLDLPESFLLGRLEPRLIPRVVDGSNVVVTSRYVVLKHKVPLDQFQTLTQRVAQLDFGVDESQIPSRQRHLLRAIRSRGIFAADDYQRHYPTATLAAHVVGFVGSGESAKDEGRVFEDFGVAGIELAFNDPLKGVHGWQTRDGLVPPRGGQTMVLTIDASIQYIVETELARAAETHRPDGLVGIVVRPRTGDILAMASWPTFDPNRPGTNHAAIRNRAISDAFEPGSTFKAITVAAALDRGVITLDERVDCENGRWRFSARDKPLHDFHPYGVLTYDLVVAKSSNIGTAKAAERLGAETLYDFLGRFGFGARTLIPLPGEAAGVLHPLERWTRSSITRVPIGHEVAATPLQMVMGAAALANGGLYLPPRLVDRFQDEQGNVTGRYPLEPPRRVLSEAAAREITRALKLVVSPVGTARRAQLEHYTVAGKTGTADKWHDGGYDSGKCYASFIGFFPADRPEVCLLVGLDEPDRRFGHTGGIVAAPVFKAIAERVANYLRIPPDILPESPASPSTPENSPAWLVSRSLASQTAERPRPVVRR
ncbi:MAG: penicillin-binding protein 2 [Verrucomicrobiales bacterium]|nr:penicillin-binding protein 2 [Verrucomicrobiales bacterium]